LQRANEAQGLLALELQHRVKNNLAVVEALAAQSARSARDVSSFLDGFLGRLRSLSAAYGLLGRGRDNVAEVGQLVAAALAPFDFPGRVAWSGPPLGISGEQAVTLALLLHELATNAVKYGALSTSHGSVRVTWSKPIGQLALIEWREADGPPVHAAKTAGLGTRLLRRGLDPSRPATTTYAAGGLTWSAQFHPSPRRRIARLPS
jgi:two-component sensor histidine kinase